MRTASIFFILALVAIPRASSQTPSEGVVYDIEISDDGHIFVGGDFDELENHSVSDLARFDGTAWLSVGEPIPRIVYAVALAGPEVYVGGPGKPPFYRPSFVERWTSTHWDTIGVFTHGCCSGDYVSDLVVSPSGNLYVAGDFQAADTVVVNSVAMWDGVKWDSMAGGVIGQFFFDTAFDAVIDLAVHDTVLYAGGDFLQAGGVHAWKIAAWDGSSWLPFGEGIPGDAIANPVTQVFLNREGQLYAIATFYTEQDSSYVNRDQVWTWTAGSWEKVAGAVVRNVHDAVIYDGDIVVAGWFEEAPVGSAVARWNGHSWERLGGLFDGWITTLEVAPDGSLLVGGAFTRSGVAHLDKIARFNGEEWEPISRLFTGVAEPRGAASISAVYPNPTNGGLVLAPGTGERGLFSLYDITGRLVRSVNVPAYTDRLILDLSGLSAGVYGWRLTYRRRAESGLIVFVQN